MSMPEMKEAEAEYKIERLMNNSQKSKHNRYCFERIVLNGKKFCEALISREILRISEAQQFHEFYKFKDCANLRYYYRFRKINNKSKIQT